MKNPELKLPAFLATLMAEVSVSRPAGADPRLHIWGTLEARLQSADLLIIAGLILTRRGHKGPARALLRQTADPETLLQARTLEHRVDTLLAREALG